LPNPQQHPSRQRILTIIYVGTAIVAVALYRGAGLPLVPSSLLGFAIVAAIGLIAYRLTSTPRGPDKPPTSR
jgi:hypothetical protein